jgi:hypothetical protein
MRLFSFFLCAFAIIGSTASISFVKEEETVRPLAYVVNNENVHKYEAPAPAYKKPLYEKSSYDAYDKESYGKESYGKDSYGQDSYGKESYGQESYGKESYGKESYGKESYGQESSYNGYSPASLSSYHYQEPGSYARPEYGYDQQATYQGPYNKPSYNSYQKPASYARPQYGQQQSYSKPSYAAQRPTFAGPIDFQNYYNQQQQQQPAYNAPAPYAPSYKTSVYLEYRSPATQHGPYQMVPSYAPSQFYGPVPQTYGPAPQSYQSYARPTSAYRQPQRAY